MLHKEANNRNSNRSESEHIDLFDSRMNGQSPCALMSVHLLWTWYRRNTFLGNFFKFKYWLGLKDQLKRWWLSEVKGQNSKIHTLIMSYTDNCIDFCCGVESVWRICINIIDYIRPQAFWFSWYYWAYTELTKKSVSQEAYQSGSPTTLKPLTDRRSRLQGTGTSGNIGSWPSWGSSLTNQTYPNISPLHTDCAISPQQSAISAMPLFIHTRKMKRCHPTALLCYSR